MAFEQRALAVEHADAGGPVNFVTAESVEVAVERLYIDGEMGHGLRAIDEDRDAAAVRDVNDLAKGIDRAERV